MAIRFNHNSKVEDMTNAYHVSDGSVLHVLRIIRRSGNVIWKVWEYIEKLFGYIRTTNGHYLRMQSGRYIRTTDHKT